MELNRWPGEPVHVLSIMNRCFLGMICCLVAAVVPASAAGFDHTYKLYGTVLAKNVKDGRVDYRALSSDHSGLQKALNEMATVSEADFLRWTRDKETAFAINLYNAAAILFISTNYPTPNVRALGTITKTPWQKEIVPLFGKKVSLEAVQQGILRRKLEEERHHFALVCGAMGYPPLRAEPYLPERLDEQFKDQAAKFLANTNANTIDLRRKVFWLSPIFRWYGADFTNRTDIVSYVVPLLETNSAAKVTALLEQGPFKVDYNEFDWALNDRR
jgi:hypothetical protein